MSEQQEVIADLTDAGVLAGARWAYLSATTRALDNYSEADGHDAALLGSLRFTLFRDRLDRVFSCGRYAVRSGNDGVDLDLLFAELPQSERDAMPRLVPGTVRRSNLNRSPGWTVGQQRFLLASGEYSKLDQLPWPQKSPTKQAVARQLHPEAPQPSLFDGFAPAEVGGLEALLEDELHLDLETFVIAHSMDPLSGQIELVFGRPRLNLGGGPAWHWRQSLLGTPPADGGYRPVDAPQPMGPDTVPDAPVRLRRPAGEQPHDRSSGER